MAALAFLQQERWELGVGLPVSQLSVGEDLPQDEQSMWADRAAGVSEPGRFSPELAIRRLQESREWLSAMA